MLVNHWATNIGLLVARWLNSVVQNQLDTSSTDISHKWDNYNGFVWKYLETMIFWEDVVKHKNWYFIRINSQNFLHTQSLWVCCNHRPTCTMTHSCMHKFKINVHYDTIWYKLPTRLIDFKIVFDHLSEKGFHFLFQHQFWYHFHRIFPRITLIYLQINSLFFPTCDKFDF